MMMRRKVTASGLGRAMKRRERFGEPVTPFEPQVSQIHHEILADAEEGMSNRSPCLEVSPSHGPARFYGFGEFRWSARLSILRPGMHEDPKAFEYSSVG
jgi:hypothetical protein